MEALAKQVVDAVADTLAKFCYETDDSTASREAALKEHLMEATETVLRNSLFLDQLAAGLGDVSQHLEKEPAETRADLRAALARTLRILAAFR